MFVKKLQTLYKIYLQLAYLFFFSKEISLHAINYSPKVPTIQPKPFTAFKMKSFNGS